MTGLDSNSRTVEGVRLDAADASAASSAVLHFLPSLADIAFLIPLVFLFAKLEGVRTLLGDGDTGWHVRTGQWILANHQAPRVDMFSFTMAGKPWFAWEWLWDVAFAVIYRHGGLGSVVLVSMVVICLTFALLYRLLLRKCGNPLVAIAVTCLAAAGTTIHWLARPHLFSFLFMVVFLDVLDRAYDGRKVLLWILPPLMVLWTNVHGGFFVGIVLIGAYAGGELLRAVLTENKYERLASARASLPYIYASLGCLAATFINPYTYHLHEHLVKYLSDPFFRNNVNEYLPTNFGNPAAFYLELELALGLLAAVWWGARRKYVEVLTILGWAHLSLIVVRNAPLYMIIGAPIVVLPITEWLRALGRAPVAGWIRRLVNGFESTAEEMAPMERPWRTHLVPAMVVVLLALAIQSAPADNKFLHARYDPKKYPEAALSYLSQPGLRIFTHDEWGDYLVYNLSPKGVKDFVDGRMDMYGTKFCQAYVDVLNVGYKWQATLDKYGVNTILMPVDAPLTGALKESSRWRVVYDDTRAIIFRRVETGAGSAGKVFTSGSGERGRDLRVTASSNVHPEDHVSQTEGARLK